jgi:hypothetical protein
MPATLVVSDLHLGARDGSDVLRRSEALERLVRALEGVERLVLLGDTIEMRHGPTRDALAPARPALERVGAAMRGGEVVLVPGNHDHALASSWLADGPRLGLEQRRAPAESSPWADQVAGALAGATVEVAYPGLWLRDDVYATHGHYLDVHTPVPVVERLLAGAMGRLVGPVPERGARPDDYEAVLAPIYAWAQAASQRVSDGPSPAGAGRSARVWTLLNAPGRRSLRVRALAGAVPVGVGLANRLGLGPLRAELTGASLRRGGLEGMREALRRLGVGAAHVIFGHTHRAGPLEGDDRSEWGPLVNAGSWVASAEFLDHAATRGPYWPGGAVELDDDGGPPRLRRLLADVPAADLSRPPARG